MVISFDAEKHEYSVDGIVRPSVTQIIRAADLMENESFYTVEARERGTAVHQACWYLDENDLDEQWLESSPLANYVRAWMRFKSDSRAQIQLIEHRVYNAQYGYCGTPDRTALIGQSSVLADLKTGQPEDWHALQSVAYAACFDHPRSYRRMTIHLRDDGSYSVMEHPAKNFMQDWRDFLAALTICQRKNRRRSVGSRSD